MYKYLSHAAPLEAHTLSGPRGWTIGHPPCYRHLSYEDLPATGLLDRQAIELDINGIGQIAPGGAVSLPDWGPGQAYHPGIGNDYTGLSILVVEGVYPLYVQLVPL